VSMPIAASRSRTPFPVPEMQSAFGLFTQQGKTNRPFQLKERGKSFIGVNNVTLSIITMRVSNEDRSPGAINSCNTAASPSRLSEIVSDNFPIPFHAHRFCLFSSLHSNNKVV